MDFIGFKCEPQVHMKSPEHSHPAPDKGFSDFGLCLFTFIGELKGHSRKSVYKALLDKVL